MIIKAEDIPPAEKWTYYDSSTLPRKYDIVYGLYPFKDRTKWKYRTLLVRGRRIDRNTGHGKLQVTYGTGELKKKQRGHIDLIIEESLARKIGLKEATRFDLDLSEELIWCYPFFKVPDWSDRIILGFLNEPLRLAMDRLLQKRLKRMKV